MVKCGIVAAWLALLGASLCGCNPETSPEISVVRVELKDWVKPEDGKTYLVAVPTWRVEGKVPVAEVWGTGRLTGPKGSFDFKNEQTPLYRGDQLDPGSGINPTTIPNDGIVVGEKDEVLAITGENPSTELYLVGSSEKTPEDQLNKGRAGP